MFSTPKGFGSKMKLEDLVPADTCSLSPLYKMRTCNDECADVQPDLFSSGKDFTVVVEGNIGSGKTTFLNNVAKWASPHVEVYPEPVNLWKDFRGHNLLDLMYKDPRRWALIFQSYVQLTMLDIHSRPQEKRIKLMERSMFSARYCFVENLQKSSLLPEIDYAILDEWFTWLLQHQRISVDLIVYIQSSPKTCFDRIHERNRKEEASVPMSYLETLHDLHEDWLVRQVHRPPPAPVLILNGDLELQHQRRLFEEHKEQILCGVVV